MQVLVSVELRHPVPGSAQSLSTEPENRLPPPQSGSRRREVAPSTPPSCCSWASALGRLPLISGLFPGKREPVRFLLPRNLPTTKRAITEVAMIMTINARPTRTSLDILGAAGATAEESRPVGETPVSRRAELAPWAQSPGLSDGDKNTCTYHGEGE